MTDYAELIGWLRIRGRGVGIPTVPGDSTSVLLNKAADALASAEARITMLIADGKQMDAGIARLEADKAELTTRAEEAEKKLLDAETAGMLWKSRAEAVEIAAAASAGARVAALEGVIRRQFNSFIDEQHRANVALSRAEAAEKALQTVAEQCRENLISHLSMKA